MLRLRTVMLGLLAATFLVAPEAQSKDMNGKFGLGFTQTLGGVSGIGARYWATRRWGIEAVVGVSLLDVDRIRVSTDIMVAVGVLYGLIQHRSANLSIGLRADIGIRARPSVARSRTVVVGDAVDTEGGPAGPADTTVQLNLEIPLLVEYFFSDSFSIHMAFGLLAVIVPDDGLVLETDGPGSASDEIDFGFGIGAGGVLGTAGFTFYF